ncbi:Uncharacterised protein [Vibrio cholerae]|nr:Uncharacterised protein [Vibrio cholerae]
MRRIPVPLPPRSIYDPTLFQNQGSDNASILPKPLAES